MARRRRSLTDENGRRLVVLNGHLPERKITTGVGAIEVRQPLVLDRRRPRNSVAQSSPARRETPRKVIGQ